VRDVKPFLDNWSARSRGGTLVNFERRDFLKRSGATALAWAGIGSSVATEALAADYPASPVRLIVPYPPGGAADVVGRIAAKHLAEKLGQSVFVDNRSGAGGPRAHTSPRRSPQRTF
jgi:tripartite-type tricarboxylate transporter receptor subunit TctC